MIKQCAVIVFCATYYMHLLIDVKGVIDNAVASKVNFH